MLNIEEQHPQLPFQTLGKTFLLQKNAILEIFVSKID